MKRLHLLYIAVATSVLPTLALAQWIWTDSNGQKVFSDMAPPVGVPDKNIIKRPSSLPVKAQVTDADSADSANKPVKVGDAKSGTDKDLEAKKKQAEAEAAAKKKADEEKQTIARLENCARAKQAKVSYESGARVATTTPNGERAYMDDAAKSAEVRRLNEVIANDCR